MAKRGPPKGTRYGGRVKGVQNKATIERELLAQRIAAEQAQKPGRKLAREVLDDLMHTFLGMAARVQPMPEGVQLQPGHLPDPIKFVEYATLAGAFAKDLAPYQSPKFKATISLNENVPGGGAMTPSTVGPAIEQMSAQQAYRLLRDADVIDVEPNHAPAQVVPIAASKKAVRK